MKSRTTRFYNYLRKTSSVRLIFYGIIFSAVFHISTILIWPTQYVTRQFQLQRIELSVILIAPSAEIPPEIPEVPESKIQRIEHPIQPEEEKKSEEEVIAEAEKEPEVQPEKEITLPPEESQPEENKTEPIIQEPETVQNPLVVPNILPEWKNFNYIQRLVEREYNRFTRHSRQNISGIVTLLVYINEDGNVVDKQIHISSGFQQLDEIALRIASQMKFTPAIHNGEKVQTWLRVPVVFELE